MSSIEQEKEELKKKLKEIVKQLKGLYIVFEGADGVGKTTLAKIFAQLIGADFTYEPFGVKGEGHEVCETLREFCLSAKYKPVVNWRAREYMMLANRAVSTKEIAEKIEQGKTVVQDRSLISGMTFAKVASGMSFNKWWRTASEAFWIFPEIVINVVNEETKIVAKGDDIYDHEKASFHKKIKQTFPDAIEFLNHKKPLKHMVFSNDFGKSPNENAMILAEAIVKDLLR